MRSKDLVEETAGCSFLGEDLRMKIEIATGEEARVVELVRIGRGDGQSMSAFQFPLMWYRNRALIPVQ